MASKFSEDEIHTWIHKTGMETLVSDCPEVDLENNSYNADEEFELWRLIKQKAFSKLSRIHNTVRYGEFIAPKLKLPTDKATPMELNLLGTHEDARSPLQCSLPEAAFRAPLSILRALPIATRTKPTFGVKFKISSCEAYYANSFEN